MNTKDEIMKAGCYHCGGTGGVDSGGFTPWGAPITLPCPACELTALREMVKELESPGVTTSDFLTPVERQRDQLEIENHRLKARIYELEGQLAIRELERLRVGVSVTWMNGRIRELEEAMSEVKEKLLEPGWPEDKDLPGIADIIEQVMKR